MIHYKHYSEKTKYGVLILAGGAQHLYEPHECCQLTCAVLMQVQLISFVYGRRPKQPSSKSILVKASELALVVPLARLVPCQQEALLFEMRVKKLEI